MASICGIINYQGPAVLRDDLARMLSLLRHRGRHSEVMHCDSGIGIGYNEHIRGREGEGLIASVSAVGGMYAITCDANISNRHDLRHTLEQRGHRFASRADAEIVLRSYMEWGTDCIGRFNGAFAFFLVDYRKRAFFIGRDRYGIRPLYYTVCNGSFLFASENKAFTVHPAFTPLLDQEAVVEYFTFQNILSQRTFFKGVRLFPAGCFSFTPMPDIHSLSITRYWDYAFEPDPRLTDEKECEEELNRLLVNAVKVRLDGREEIGSYLSGGIDSGSITAIAAREIPYIKTFTCGFDLHSASGIEQYYDERLSAEHMSYLFKTEHYEMVLKAGDMENSLPTVVWHIEEPRVGQSYPNYCIARLASRLVSRVFGGSGGDEFFAGYLWRYSHAADARSFDDYIDKYYAFWQRLIPSDRQSAFFSPMASLAGQVDTKDIFRGSLPEKFAAPSTCEDYLNLSLGFEAKTFLHGLLVVEDKLGMATGLELLLPFLDNDLVDFALKLPIRMKIHDIDATIASWKRSSCSPKDHFAKSNSGKKILRTSMSRYIPQRTANGQKQGFSAPDSSWFKGDSIDYVRAKLLQENARLYDYLDRKEVRALIHEHLEGRCNRRLAIWSLLCFEKWLRLYLP